jgi:short-subunit dehydrogenase
MKGFSTNCIVRMAFDVNSDTEVQRLIVETEGRIDDVVNNAGVGAPGAFQSSRLTAVASLLTYPGDLIDDIEALIQRAFDTNAAVIPAMVKQKQGFIVNIGSIVGGM